MAKTQHKPAEAAAPGPLTGNENAGSQNDPKGPRSTGFESADSDGSHQPKQPAKPAEDLKEAADDQA